MRRLEIIQVRTAQKNQLLLEQYLAGWLAQVSGGTQAQNITIYRHVSVETDFSIHLRHDSETEQADLALGERLASALREFGLVNHAVWIEHNPKMK